MATDMRITRRDLAGRIVGGGALVLLIIAIAVAIEATPSVPKPPPAPDEPAPAAPAPDAQPLDIAPWARPTAALPMIPVPTVRHEPAPLVPLEPAADSAPLVRFGASPFRGLGEPLEVRGRIVDGEGAPVAGADVRFLPHGELLTQAGLPASMHIPNDGLRTAAYPTLVRGVWLDELPSTRSDAEGRFTLVGIDAPRGELWDPFAAPAGAELVVRAEGLATRIVSVADVQWDDAEFPAIDLRRAGRVEGRVVDARGAPVSGVLVWPRSIRRDDTDYEPPSRLPWFDLDAVLDVTHAALTDDAGRFALHDLWPGHYGLQFEHEAYALERVEQLHVRPGRRTELDDVTLARGFAVSGRVLDERGAGVPGAAVFATARVVDTTGRGCVYWLLEPDDDALPYELEARWFTDTRRTRTDASGRFQLEGLTHDEEHTLYAVAPGHEGVRGPTLRQPSRDLLLHLPTEAVLDVVLRTADGAPVPRGAQLTARRVVGPMHVPSGRPLSPRADGFRVHRVGALGTQLELLVPGMAAILEHTSGQPLGTRGTVELVLHPEAVVHGRAFEPDGETPAADLPVRVTHAGSDWFDSPAHRTRTDAEGRFRLRALAEGQATLHVGYGTWQQHAELGLEPRAGQTIGELRVVLEPPAPRRRR